MAVGIPHGSEFFLVVVISISICMSSTLCRANDNRNRELRGYQVTVRMLSYANPKSHDADEAYCDRFFLNPDKMKCDVQIKLKVDCSFCINSGEAIYPRATGENFYPNVDYIYAWTFEQSGQKITLQVNDSGQGHLTVNAEAWDMDDNQDDLIGKASTSLSLESLPLQETFNALLQYRDWLKMAAGVTVSCMPNTCGTRCYWPSPSANTHCSGGRYICSGIFRKACDYVEGRFYYFFSLETLRKNRYLIDNDAQCQVRVSACTAPDTAECAENDWQKVALLKDSAESMSIDLLSGDSDHYEYYREVDLLPERSRLIVLAALQCAKHENKTIKVDLRLGTSVYNNTLQVEEQGLTLRGTYGIRCRRGYGGSFCNIQCKGCGLSGSTWVCGADRGPTCTYKALCAGLECDQGGTCMVNRVKDRYVANCRCLRGYEGSHCEQNWDGKEECGVDYCTGRGRCRHNWDEKGFLHRLCVCDPEFEGHRCELPVGRFALTVELDTFKNKHGVLQNGAYCDNGLSRCDTHVVVCSDEDCQMVVQSVNRDELSAILPGDAVLTYERNLTAVANTTFTINFQVLAGERDASPIVEFSRVVRFPYLFYAASLYFTNARGISLHAVATLRCARGRLGTDCRMTCKPGAQHSISRSPAAFDLCWPHPFLVCADGTVGPGCALQHYCARANCPLDRCLLNDGGVWCGPSVDACTAGVQTCSRRGQCVALARDGSKHAECLCPQGFGGSSCQFDHWCPTATARNESASIAGACLPNGTCVLQPHHFVYDCFCSHAYTRTPAICRATDPCSLISCHNNAVCSFDYKANIASCTCRNGYSGTNCETETETKNGYEKVIGVSVFALVIVLLLSCTMSIAATVCYRSKICVKHQQEDDGYLPKGRTDADGYQDQRLSLISKGSVSLAKQLNSQSLSQSRMRSDARISRTYARECEYASYIARSANGEAVNYYAIQLPARASVEAANYYAIQPTAPNWYFDTDIY